MTGNTDTRTFFGARSDDSALFSAAAVEQATRREVAGGESSCTIDARALIMPPRSTYLGLASSATTRARSPRGRLRGAAAALAVVFLGSLSAVAAGPRGDTLRHRHAHAASEEYDDLEVELYAEVALIPEAAAPVRAVAASESTRPSAMEEVARPKAKAMGAVKATSSAKGASSKGASQGRDAGEVAAPAGPDPMSVDCLLEPAKCRREEAAPAPAPVVPKGPELPAKLDAASSKASLAPTRARAKSECAALAAGGEKVEVKLSVAGESGSVVASEVLGEWAGSGLGECVAHELAATRFERFAAPQQGMSVTVRF